MATHNIFHAGEGGAATALGSNAWSMYPRPNIICNKEYKGPAQYSGAVTMRIAGTTDRFVSDGGLSPVVRYLQQANVVDGDELAVIVVPAHWKLNSITLQVYNKDEMAGIYEGGATAAATGQTGAVTVVLRQPACTALGLAAADTAIFGSTLLSTSSFANLVPSAPISTGNRLIVVGLPTAPTNWANVNFEVTCMMEKIRDIGRPT